MAANIKVKKPPLSAWLLLALLSGCTALAAYEFWVEPLSYYFNPLYFENMFIAYFNGALAFLPLVLCGISLIGWFLLLFGVEKGTPLTLFVHIITLVIAIPSEIFGLFMIFISSDHLTMLIRFLCMLVPLGVSCAVVALLNNWKDLMK